MRPYPRLNQNIWFFPILTSLPLSYQILVVYNSDPNATRHPTLSPRSLSESDCGDRLALSLPPVDDGQEIHCAHQRSDETHGNVRPGADRRSSIAKVRIQGWAKEWSLGCVNLQPAARGSQEAGFTQPRDHSFAQPCTEQTVYKVTSYTVNLDLG